MMSQGCVLLRVVSLACRWCPFTLCSHVHFLVYVCVSLVSSPCKDTGMLDWGHF
jgi:hypothetical protein